MKILFLYLIRFYQNYVSKFLGKNCRFYPTCSNYTYQAIEIHGCIIGLYFGMKRLLKCHPFYNGEFFDPVPPKKTARGNKSNEDTL